MKCCRRLSKNQCLKRHLLLCNSAAKEIYPKPNSYLSFDQNKAAKYSSTIDVFGFADFECKLLPLETNCNGEGKNDEMNDKSFTYKKEAHIVISYSLIFIDKFGKLLFEKCYCGKNAGLFF